MKNELQPSAAHFLLYKLMCGLHTFYNFWNSV